MQQHEIELIINIDDKVRTMIAKKMNDERIMMSCLEFFKSVANLLVIHNKVEHDLYIREYKGFAYYVKLLANDPK